jgi:hypothetical protein
VNGLLVVRHAYSILILKNKNNLVLQTQSV